MINHIYGKSNALNTTRRPNLFIKELKMYIDHLKDKLDEQGSQLNKVQEKYFSRFAVNLMEGINYYKEMFEGFCNEFEDVKENALQELKNAAAVLNNLELLIQNKQTVTVLS